MDTRGAVRVYRRRRLRWRGAWKTGSAPVMMASIQTPMGGSRCRTRARGWPRDLRARVDDADDCVDLRDFLVNPIFKG